MTEVKIKSVTLNSAGNIAIYPNSLTEILLILIVLVSSSMLIKYHWSRRRMYRMASKLNGPKGLPIIGSAHLFAGSTENILSTILDLTEKYGTPAKIWLGNRLFFGIYEPAHLEILFNHPKAIGKDPLVNLTLPVLGEGLFSAPVEKWKKNRKIIAPAFNQRILNNFVNIFAIHATVLGNVLQNHTYKVFDVSQFVGKCSLDIVCETSMGIKVNAQLKESEFLNWVETLLSITYRRMFQIWYHPDIIFYNSALGRQYKIILKKFINYTNQVVFNKKAAYYKQRAWSVKYPEAATDEESSKMKTFLDLLIELTEESDTFTNEQLRDEVNTFLIGGADTTTSSMSFGLIMLGMHSTVQQKVYEEVMDVLGPDRPVEYTDLPNLKYTERFIQETNRIFPIGPVVVRTHEDDICLGDVTLPAGSSSVLVILRTHRSEQYWPDPLKFDPDRFLPEEIAKRHPYAYVPFTGGPRVCIGKKYAIMMLKTLIAHIIRKFRIDTPYMRIEDIRLKQDLIMKPVDGYKISLAPRD